MVKYARESKLKRPEEKYKYIFKKCIKKLKARFEATTKLDRRNFKKAEFEKLFYEFYFRDIAKAANLSLGVFYQPRNTGPSSNEPKHGHAAGDEPEGIPKTISVQYIQNISRCPQFIADFHQYLENELLRDYSEKVNDKVRKMVGHWTGPANAPPAIERIQEICTKIEGDIKLKMPWTISEVSAAIDATRAIFLKVNAPGHQAAGRH